MKSVTLQWITICFLLLQSVPTKIVPASGIWYVTTGGNDAQNCLTVSTPCATINAAIGKANPNDTILVAEGKYKGITINVNKSITLSGGWNTSFSQHSSMAIANGEKIRRCMIIESNVTVVVEQFLFLDCYQLLESGGGIYSQGYLTVNRSSFWNNYAMQQGGAIDAYDGSLSIDNVTFTGNRAMYGGAVANNIYNYSAQIKNATITENRAVYGGGIYGGFEIENTILTGNFLTGGTGQDCYDNGKYISSSGYNIIGTIFNCNFIQSTGDQIGIDPLFGVYNPISGYYPLQGGSPAIDAGNPADCPSLDQRGDERPLDGNQDGITRCDIGAIEYTPNIGPASIISIYAGDTQRVPLGFDFHIPFTVLVTDIDGNPINGNQVTFTTPTSGASGAFSTTPSNQTTVTTNGAGLAFSPIFTANNVQGSYEVTASANGIPSLLNFHETNAPLWYVAPSGTGNNANACNEVAAPCLTVDGVFAKPGFVSGDGIRMMKGTYPSFSILTDISISGGWDTSFTSQDGYSAIDGENTNRSLTINLSTTSSQVTLEKMVIKNGNATSNGGGIYIRGGEIWIDQFIIFNNHAGTIYGNSYSGYGGGMDISNSKVHISDSTITMNSSDLDGGGILFDQGTQLSLINTTILGNTVPNGTSAGNLTFGSNGNPTLTISNSILEDCFRGSSIGLYDPEGTMISKGNNIMGSQLACFGYFGQGQPTDRFGIDPGVVIFTDYGITGLIPDSPAIDMANPSACSSVDEISNERPIDGDLDGSAVCDIGAYEMNGNGISADYVFTYPKITYWVGMDTLEPSTFQAVVWDSFGRGVPGVNVTFTAPATGSGGLFIETGTNTKTVMTNSLGIASVDDYYATSSSGSYTILVSVEGSSSTDTIDIINGHISYIYLPIIIR